MHGVRYGALDEAEGIAPRAHACLYTIEISSGATPAASQKARNIGLWRNMGLPSRFVRSFVDTSGEQRAAKTTRY